MSLSSLIKILLQPAMGWYIKKKRERERKKAFMSYMREYWQLSRYFSDNVSWVDKADMLKELQ